MASQRPEETEAAPTLHDEISRLAENGFPKLADMLRSSAKFHGKGE